MISILDGNEGASAAKSKAKACGVLCLVDFPRRREEYCWIVARLISFDDFLLMADQFAHE
jgi:hypothetical protein